jgi:uncharacterized repeat protein (TIGR01451 family)
MMTGHPVVSVGRLTIRLSMALVLVTAVAGAVAGLARAEGSAQLYPVDASCTSNASGGSCRANIEWRTSSYGPATGAQVRRRTYLQVYASAGEVLVMGSSAVGVGAGDILIYNPGVVTDVDAQPLPSVTTGVNGFRCSDQRTSSGNAAQGRITSRALEIAGAQAVSGGGNPSGYIPCSYVAPTSGLYGVVFYGPSGDGSDVDGGVSGETTLASSSNFDATQATSIAAWDITVRPDATSTTGAVGRLFTKALAAYTAGNGRPINVSVNVVTTDGFRYRTDTRGLDPNGFAFYGNQVGFFDGDGTSPLYHDAYGTTNSGQLTALAGGVTFAAPTFPIFFGVPDAATLTALGIPLTAVAPTISALAFAGNVSGNTSSVGAGGTFSYTSGTAGVYEIVISRDGVDFDPGASQNRVLRGIRPAGTQSVAWNGKDNGGADFPVGTNYPVRASLHAGEYHFPLIDAENSTLGGPTFTLLNPPGGSCSGGSGCTTAFFDDRGYRTVGPSAASVGAAPPPDTPLCGGGPPPAPYHSDAVSGFDTSGSLRAFGANSGGNTNAPCTGSFGDVKGLDMWTFFPSTTSTSTLDVVASADLSIVKTHAGSFTVGQGATYTLALTNAGSIASGAVTVVDTLPTGVAFVGGSGSGWTCGAIGQAVTCTLPTGLASGASSAITLSVQIGPAAAPSVTNTATVSATVFDPNSSNNSSSDPTTVIPIPAAVADSATTGPGSAVTISVLGNDTLGVGPTSITSSTAPAHGSVTCTATDCTYTPTAGFTGVDTFTYTITDANGRTSTATVTVTVAAPSPPSNPTPAPPAAPAPPALPSAAEADVTTTVRGPTTASAGTTVSLVADVRNNGSGTAPNTVATLTVPAQFSPRAGTITIDGFTAGDACTIAVRAITCRLGTLLSGSSARITWQAAVAGSASAGTYVVRSNAASPVIDPVPANNPSAWTIGVTRSRAETTEPKLKVSATNDRATVRPGGAVQTTIVVRNVGPGVASGVLVCMPAPASSSFVTASGAVFRRGAACWSIARLSSGTGKRFTVVFRIDTTARPGPVRSIVRVTAPGTRGVLSAQAPVTVLGGRPAGRPGGVTG